MWREPQDVRGWSPDRWLTEAMVQAATLGGCEDARHFAEAVCGGEHVVDAAGRFPWKDDVTYIDAAVRLCRGDMGKIRLPLLGFTSPGRAFTQPDYPAGPKVRCLRQVWVESSRYGMRQAARTSIVRFMAHELGWNKPKYGIYHEIMLIVLDLTNGHIEWPALTMGSSEEEIRRFAETFKPIMDADMLKRLEVLQRMKEVLDRPRG